MLAKKSNAGDASGFIDFSSWLELYVDRAVLASLQGFAFADKHRTCRLEMPSVSAERPDRFVRCQSNPFAVNTLGSERTDGLEIRRAVPHWHSLFRHAFKAVG